MLVLHTAAVLIRIIPTHIAACILDVQYNLVFAVHTGCLQSMLDFTPLKFAMNDSMSFNLRIFESFQISTTYYIPVLLLESFTARGG